MNIASASKTFAGLWPSSDWTNELHTTFWERVSKLNLGTEQIDAVMREHRMTTRWKSPTPKDLFVKFQIAAAGPAAYRPTSGEYVATPFEGERIGLREYTRRKRELGEDVHPLLAAVVGRTPEQNEKSRKDRQEEWRRRSAN
tara:strand:+ start:5889 stop:6314 length:426 start_codon:yes stop_codon:yes gene_type:complete